MSGTMNKEDLAVKLQSISDDEVQSYLSQVEEKLGSFQTHNVQDFGKFFEALGMTSIEANSLANYFKENFHTY